MGRKKNQVTPVAQADREFVLGAAARLFRQKGFDKTTVKEIAEACDMLPGSLHYRYPSKESILVDLMRLALEQASTALSEAIRGESEPLEQLRQGINAHLELLVGGSDMVYVLLFEWRSLQGQSRKEMIDLRDRYELLWSAMIQSLSSQNLIRADVDRDLLRLIGLGALNWVATWFNEGGRYTVKDIGDFVWVVIKDGVLKR
ncbi:MULTISPECIES: TetR/AcrR family transcriptional regulator [Alcanivorax]|uniref:TetR family transcriptional regulator n=7 Tax=Gammaproteobacteria TaxID=1236 RepID=A0A6N7LX84_9GAMM|nr:MULTISPECIES: TetR/AcrR family transcriptional regulator [Alcanivorax]KZX73912.1 TetR family transcriptional regulator [Alcanivorax sp. HI0013]KZX85860.1 TetR family transcriptional regulator [Alcanivorax sp. HI0011]KZY10984.1 TetR family transcriptional regulator [Alcanivorax sp. HI0035]MCG8439966.1 TetR/AcrR family transcriptional regulator [Pseudomonadales bacterium]MCK0152485.1 TetR/AcrR family transcriptional regulator [Alcanivorax sp. S6407]MZR63449.1 TetR family transcriptional regu